MKKENDYYFFCLINKQCHGYTIPALTTLHQKLANYLFFTDEWYRIVAEIIFINGYK